MRNQTTSTGNIGSAGSAAGGSAILTDLQAAGQAVQAGLLPAQGVMPQGGTVRVVSNVGVCIAERGQQILVDVLNEPDEETGPLYRTIAPHLAGAVVQGTPPFTANAMLVTHNHADHCSPRLLQAFMQGQPAVPIGCGGQVAEALDSAIKNMERVAGNGTSRIPENGIGGAKAAGGVAPFPFRSPLHVFRPSVMGGERSIMGGVEVTAVSLVHAGASYAGVENLGFIISPGKTYVHTGDAAPTPANMHVLAAWGGRGAVVIAPFPYLSLTPAFEALRSILEPAALVVTHLPPKESAGKEGERWWRSVYRAAEKQQGCGFPVHIAEVENQVFSIK